MVAALGAMGCGGFRFPAVDGMAVEPGEGGEEDCGGEHGARACGEAGERGQCAGGGEEQADEQFFRKQGSEPARTPGQMDSREVGERGGGENGVALAEVRGHERDDDDGGCG